MLVSIIIDRFVAKRNGRNQVVCYEALDQDTLDLDEYNRRADA